MSFLFFKTIKEVKCLAIKYAEYRVVKIPIPSVTAKPLTGPDPNANNINSKILCSICRVCSIDYCFNSFKKAGSWYRCVGYGCKNRKRGVCREDKDGY